MAQTDLKSYRHQTPPLWRDIRVLQMAGQFIFALIVLAVAWQLVNNVLDALQVLGQRPDFRFWREGSFFQQPSRWSFSEGPGLTSTDTFGRAYIVGIINTLRAIVLGIILATILGIFIGVGRLSTNFLVRTIAAAYVELFQNTPLLVQLIFLYRGVFLTLPQIENAVVFPSANFQDSLFRLAVYVSATVIGMGALWHLRGLLRARQGGEGPNPALGGHIVIVVIVIGICAMILFIVPADLIYLSSRGLVIPAFHPTDSFPIWLASLGLGLLAGAFLWVARARRERLTGLPSHPWTYALGAFAAIALVGWFVAGASPLSTDIPAPQIATLSDGREVVRRISGGETISPEYAALVVGLILYTAAFIGEIVRAGIQAVSYGQLEAAYALGLSKAETLRRIVLPQALRVIIPPLGNQYLNLTKNSSLATAIGFMDVFAVTRTIIHQAGQGVVMIISVMLTYLIASLTISLAMNWLNGRMRLKER